MKDDPHDSDATFEDLVARYIQAMESEGAEAAERVLAEQPGQTAEARELLERLDALGLLRPPGEESLPDRIGPYEILGELGSGGMGSVYLAEQHAPVRRSVAVKVIKVGMNTADVVKRFRAEQQTLALLDHPSIAEVYDAGTTDEGRPYFVMEYVPGEPLTAYCEQARLPLEDRLRLFVTVCEAVQYAHQKGVLHRDLKPTNILVTLKGQRPVPKVIDFGIAKASGAALVETALQTLPGQIVGTPEYMSPEQAESTGLDVDTRTDVYSLGVILYELLSGALPFSSNKLRSRGVIGMLQTLKEETPPLPSVRASSERPEATTIDRSLRRLRGDLDWIVMRALEKEPERRYPSAQTLAEDVQRHLRHEPVDASPPTWRYRLRKLVRRHRVEVAAAGAVFVALVLGLAFSIRYGLIAEQRARDAEAAEKATEAALEETREFFYLASDAVHDLINKSALLRHVPKATPVRRQILESALETAGKMQELRPREEELRDFLFLHRVMTSELRNELGDTEGAFAEAEEGLQLLDGLLAAAPGDPALLRSRAILLGSLAVVHFSAGDFQAAHETSREAVAAVEEAGERGAIGHYAKVNLAGVWANYAKFCFADAAEALRALEQARSLYGSLAAPRLEDLYTRLSLRVRIGVRLGETGQLDRAAEEVEAAIREYETLSPHPTRDTHVHEAYGSLAYVQSKRAGRLEESLAAVEKLVEVSRRLAEGHPGWPRWQLALADALSDHAELLDRNERHDEALERHAEAVAALRELRRQDSGDTAAWRCGVGLGQYAIALIRMDFVDPGSGHLEAALEHMTEGLALVDGLEGLDSHRKIERENLRLVQASILDRLERREEALELFEVVAGRLDEMIGAAPESPLYASYLAQMFNQYSRALWYADRLDDAAHIASEGIAAARRTLSLSPNHAPSMETLAQLRNSLGHIHVDRGELEAADEQAEALVARFPDAWFQRLVAAEILSRCADATDDVERREAWGARAVAHLARGQELGFEPEGGWPAETPCEVLGGRADFEALFPPR